MTEDDLIIQTLRRENESLKKVNGLLNREIREREEEIGRLKQQAVLQRGEIVRYRRMIGLYEERKERERRDGNEDGI